MEIIKVKNYRGLSNLVADIIEKDILKKKQGFTIGLATGKTVKKLYKILVRKYKDKKIDFSKVKAFALDEYYPISKNNKKSYYHFLHKRLFNKVNFKEENIHLLNGETKNLEKECKEYENKIKKNKIDLQILGIGINGHIGFNEPGKDSNANSKTRLIKLNKETLSEKRPSNKALTMGISTILKAKKIILLASGKKKAKAIYEMLNGEINSDLPASFMRKHKNFILIVDKKAGSLL